MKKFYFVGGPKLGFFEEFFTRLKNVGGLPKGWTIYPHANEDGKVLHIVETNSLDDILTHLNNFNGIYENSDIVEIIERS